MESVDSGAAGHVTYVVCEVLLFVDLRNACVVGVLINPHVSVYCIWKLALAVSSGVVGGAKLLEN